jgi:hypothetical protein
MCQISILSQRTETVTNSKGTTTVSESVTVTQTTANSVTATTSEYLADGSTLDGTSVQETVTNSDGSATTTLVNLDRALIFFNNIASRRRGGFPVTESEKFSSSFFLLRILLRDFPSCSTMVVQI